VTRTVLGDLPVTPLHPAADLIDLAAEAAAALGTVAVIALSQWLRSDTETLDALVLEATRRANPVAPRRYRGRLGHPHPAVTSRASYLVGPGRMTPARSMAHPSGAVPGPAPGAAQRTQSARVHG
jgi:hypothetical protein